MLLVGGGLLLFEIQTSAWAPPSPGPTPSWALGYALSAEVRQPLWLLLFQTPLCLPCGIDGQCKNTAALSLKSRHPRQRDETQGGAHIGIPPCCAQVQPLPMAEVPRSI